MLTAVLGIGGLVFIGATFGAGQFWELRKWNQGKKSLEGRPSASQVNRTRGQCSFRVSNVGKSAITHLWPQLVDDTENVCSVDDKNRIDLLSGERAELILKLIPPGDQHPLRLHFEWYDESTRETRRVTSRAIIPNA